MNRVATCIPGPVSINLGVFALALAFLLLACGGEPELDPQAPEQIGQMKRTSLTTGAKAKAIIDALHMANPATEQSWVATFGDGDRLVIYATAFETSQLAAIQHAAMNRRLSMRTPRYSTAAPATVSQQAGFRIQDTAEGKHIFLFQRGRWMVGVAGIAPDLEAAVASIEWIEAK